MFAILWRFFLVSSGATQAWNPSGGRSGEPDDRMMALVEREEQPPYIFWEAKYKEEKTYRGRESVIGDAQTALDSWTKRVAPQVAGKSLVELILEDGEGWEPAIVAQRYGVDPGFVRRKRMAAGRGLEDGRALLKPEEEVDRPSRARELRQSGLSTREIAAVLGCHQTQVMRWIREKAA